MCQWVHCHVSQHLTSSHHVSSCVGVRTMGSGLFISMSPPLSLSGCFFVTVATFLMFYLYHSVSVHLQFCVVYLYLPLCLCLSILIVSQVSLLCSEGTCANEGSRKNRTEQHIVRSKTERKRGKEDRNTARREKSDERPNDRGESRDEISTSRYIYINIFFTSESDSE